MLDRQFIKYPEAVALVGDEESLRQAIFRRELRAYIELWHVQAVRKSGDSIGENYGGIPELPMARWMKASKNVGDYAISGWFRLSPWDSEILGTRNAFKLPVFVWPAGLGEPEKHEDWFQVDTLKHPSGAFDQLAWFSTNELAALLPELGCMQEPDNPQNKRWPWGDHETEYLRLLGQAASRFWKLYDPADATTAPTNEQVENWLKKQTVNGRPVSANVARAMATILRADGLPTGPRK